MRRLTIHLNQVEKTGGTIYNTHAFLINNDDQIPKLLGKFGGNVKKYYVSNINPRKHTVKKIKR